jgi:hypothetical protein
MWFITNYPENKVLFAIVIANGIVSLDHENKRIPQFIKNLFEAIKGLYGGCNDDFFASTS